MIDNEFFLWHFKLLCNVFFFSPLFTSAINFLSNVPTTPPHSLQLVKIYKGQYDAVKGLTSFYCHYLSSWTWIFLKCSRYFPKKIQVRLGYPVNFILSCRNFRLKKLELERLYQYISNFAIFLVRWRIIKCSIFLADCKESWPAYWFASSRYRKTDWIQDIYTSPSIFWSSGLCIYDGKWTVLQFSHWKVIKYWYSNQS